MGARFTDSISTYSEIVLLTVFRDQFRSCTGLLGKISSYGDF